MAQAISNLAVGSKVKLKVDGTDRAFLVVHQGNPSTSLYDSSCNGTWLLMEDLYKVGAYGNTNSYNGSVVHSYLNNTFFSLLGAEVQAAVKEAKIPYHYGTAYDGKTVNLKTGANGLSAKVFCLSHVEVGIDFYYDSPSFKDGAKLDYFIRGSSSSGNANADTLRIAYYNGTAHGWWTRSPTDYFSEDVQQVVHVQDTGGGNCQEPTNSIYIYYRPAMVMSSDYKVSDNTDGDGCYTLPQPALYAGAMTDIPIYEETEVSLGGTPMYQKVLELFDVEDSSYYFRGLGNGFSSTNYGVDSSTAKSVWTAKYDITTLNFTYVVSSESGYDKLTIKVGGTTVVNAISGSNSGTWSGSLKKGEKIELTYTKDSSSESGDDQGYIGNFDNTTYKTSTQIGSETREVAQKVKKLYWGDANNIAQKIKKLYCGDENGIAQLVWQEKTLNDYTWAELNALAASGDAKNLFAVGDCKAITLNGTVGTLSLSNYTTYVYIIGFDHNGAMGTIDFGTFKTALSGGTDLCLIDSKYDRNSTDGTKYFNMNHSSNTSADGWKGCDLRYDVLGSTNTNNGDAGATTATSPVSGTLMAALPADLRAVMKPMTIYTDNKGGATDTASNVSASVDYLPLLAEFEIFGTRTYANSAEKNYQKQYAYYSAGNSKVKYRHSATGSTAGWRERSPNSNNSGYFCGVNTNGVANHIGVRVSHGIAPIFRV